VGGYTQRLITNPNDKLPALSAMAKLMEERSGEEYIAGLWKSHLAIGLLWRRAKDFVTRPTEDFRAPSWSWASVDGAVHMPDELEIEPSGSEIDPCVTDISAETTPRYADPRGMLSSGHLSLTGRLKAIGSRLDPQSQDRSRPVVDGLDDLWDNGEAIGVGFFDEAYKPSRTEPSPVLFCLKVAERRHANQRWYGLLLEPTGEANEYRRVGFGRTEFLGHVDWFSDVEPQAIRIV